MGLAYNVAVLTEMISSEVGRRGRGAQTDLARAIGVEVQTVNKWVHGQTHPDPARWAAIEKALGWEPGSIALRVMPSLGADSTHDLVIQLAEQVEDLARRVQALEGGRPRGARAGS